MSDLASRIAGMSPKRVALVALELDARVHALEAAAREPIAIVGLACRFPGAPNAEAYWRLLVEGRDAVRTVPRERWDIDAWYDPNPEAVGRMASRWGGFLDDIDQFDAALFGISPREAAGMDPQQRLLLEVAWEALEHAGQAPDRLNGSATGVFVGLCNSDYHQLLIDRGVTELDAYVATGSASSVASGRVSYVLGLQGPSVSIDTACSSSLVALHYAVNSLRAGESSMALAAGVNIVCSPLTTVALSRARMMAPDGRCKAFDASADGFVRGEGCGVVVLKRLSDALANRDRVLAVIRGSAANQDGRSSGLTAPNGPSQEAVVRRALANGGLAPADIDYVEAHGTGTSLGDPIEVRAIGAALGVNRPADRPIVIGSVKANLGHLESAAGIAGVIKVVLALQHRELPASIHFTKPNPHIPWADLPVRVNDRLTPWPDSGRPRLAGVSSFGFSGTNAHVILEEAPAIDPARAVDDRPQHVFVLSARSEAALREQVRRVGAEIDRVDLADVCFTLASGRAHLAHRLACGVGSSTELRGQLDAWLRGESSPRVWSRRQTTTSRPDVTLLFTGQGAQYPGMARALYEGQPAFRSAFDRCVQALVGHLDTPLDQMIFAGDDARLNEPGYAQPANFALSFALTEMWRAWGVGPSAVVGHSLGEFVAVCVAGMCDPEEMIRLVATRGRLMQSLPPTGAMAAVFVNAARVEAILAGLGNGAGIAAHNHPEQTVVSGDRGAVDEVVRLCMGQGINCEALRASHGYHSPAMQPIVSALVDAARGIVFRAPSIAVVSTLTGEVLKPGELTAEYWGRQLVAPVRFVEAVARLRRLGQDVFLEAGPTPVLSGMGRICAAEADWLPSLKAGRSDWEQITDTAAQLHLVGVPIDWEAFDRPYPRRRLALPTYSFEHERHWLSSPGERPASNGRQTPPLHPLLGWRVDHPVPTFESRLKISTIPALGDHRVAGGAVVPGPVYFEMALAAARLALGEARYALDEVSLREPLFLDDGRDVLVQTLVHDEDGGARIEVVSLDPAASSSRWRRHMQARLVTGASATVGSGDLARAQRDCTTPVDLGDFLDGLRAREIEIAASALLEAAWSGRGEALVQLRAAAGALEGARIDPAIFDAAMLAVAIALAETSGAAADGSYFLVAVDAVRVGDVPVSGALWSYVQTRADGGDARPRLDLTLFDAAGAVVARVEGMRFERSRAMARGRGASAAPADWFYDVSWEAMPGIDGAVATSPMDVDAAIGALPARLSALGGEHDLDEYFRLGPALDRACAAYVVAALRQLGWAPGAELAADTVADQLGVAPRHRQLLGLLLKHLGADGVLTSSGAALRLDADAAGSGDVLMAELHARHPRMRAQIEMTARCGRELAGVLTGTIDPLHLLFEGGSLASAAALYQDTPSARAFNALVGDAVAAVLAAHPTGRLRVLEIGAGTGGTTSAILPRLPADRAEYVFTDMSPVFFVAGRQKFGAFPFVEYRALDIERDPASQGFAGRRFDLIVAANVLHATGNMRQTLSHVESLLAPGGSLVLLEGTHSERWVDLTFGLTEGWWRFTDEDVRQDGPVVSAASWRRLLEGLGLRTSILPETSERQLGALPLAVIVARRERERATPETAAAPTWVVTGDDQRAIETFVRAIAQKGGSAAALTAPQDPARIRDEVAAQLKALSIGDPIDVVLLSTNASGDAPDLDAVVVAQRALARIQGAIDAGVAVRLWLVTSGAQAPGLAELPDATLAGVWGLGRVVALEHPEIWGGLVDLDPAESFTSQADRLVALMGRAQGEDQIALRRDGPLVARLTRTTPPAGSPIAIHADGAYLISGGFGGLGLTAARWLVDRGARTLVFVGRRGLEGAGPDQAERQRAVDALEAAGARVEAVAADIADRDAMAALFSRFGVDLPPLRGLIHAAVAMTQSPVRDLDATRLADMVRTKVEGGRILLAASASQPLDFAVLFSSTTALVGAAGLAHYAAANASLDALAVASRRQRRPVTSINWGTWDRMRAASEADRRSFVEGGLLPMSSERALDALAIVLGAGVPQMMIADIDWRTLRALYEARRRRPLLERLDVIGRVDAVERPARRLDLRVQVAALSGDAARGLVDAFVRAETAHVLGIRTPEAIDGAQGLFDMGLDSLMAIDLKTRLETGVGERLPSTLTFNYPNVNALAAFLADDVLGVTRPPASGASGADAERGTDASPASSDMDDLSEDELELLLRQRLGEI